LTRSTPKGSFRNDQAEGRDFVESGRHHNTEDEIREAKIVICDVCDSIDEAKELIDILGLH